jgi:YD repeat-containing protein
VAIAENATLTQIAYTSFETSEKGGWTYSGSPVTSASNSKTGRKYYNLSTGVISKASLPAGNYKLSFWARTSSGTTDWIFLGVTETLTTTWKLIERTVSGSVSIPVGSVWIDELRLHPTTSLMTTSTYSPMVGATSVTDGSNKITYYEYDLLGRLIRIKDQDGFIIKQYQYSYSNPN